MLGLLLAFAPHAHARIFTAKDGRTIDAKLVSIYQNQITFKRLDTGKVLTVPLNQFSEKDRRYIIAEKEAGRLNLTSYNKDNVPSVAAVKKIQNHFTASQEIDRLLDGYRQSKGVEAAPVIDDATFLRRAYLKIIGRIPTHAEAVHFLQDSDPYKRASLVDKLLDSQGYVSHNFNLWADVLRARTTGRDGSRHGGVYYVPWLKEQIRDNVPYDEFVKTLLTAEGYPWENPAVAYYLRDFGMPLDNMSMTAQIFLGTQMQCAQCHDHPTDVWTQKDFYELSAYTYGLKTGVNITNTESPESQEILRRLKEISKRQNGGKVPQYQKASPLSAGREFFDPLRWGVIHTERQLKLPHDYQYDDAKPKDIVEPKILFGNAADADLHDSASRIESYADWMVAKNNKRFTLVIANRMWKHVMGKGLIEPVDNLTDESVPDSPELMAYLEDVMQAVDYDLKQYLRILYNTKQFQRAAVIDNPDLDDDYALEGPIFQRMSSEQIWDSIATLMMPDIDERIKQSYTSNQGGVRYETGKTPAAALFAEEMSAEDLTDHIMNMSEVYNAYHTARTELTKANRDPDLKNTQKLKDLKTAANAARKEWNALLNPDFSTYGPGIPMGMTAMSAGDTMDSQPKPNNNKKNNKQPWYYKDLYRASELPSPIRNGHLLEVFGQSDRMLIENSDDGSNVLQALFLLNSAHTNKLLADHSEPVREALLVKTPEEKLETIYIGFLARKPTEAEKAALLPSLEENPDKARQRIIWAMLNTQQFIFIQ